MNNRKEKPLKNEEEAKNFDSLDTFLKKRQESTYYEENQRKRIEKNSEKKMYGSKNYEIARIKTLEDFDSVNKYCTNVKEEKEEEEMLGKRSPKLKIVQKKLAVEKWKNIKIREGILNEKCEKKIKNKKLDNPLNHFHKFKKKSEKLHKFKSLTKLKEINRESNNLLKKEEEIKDKSCLLKNQNSKKTFKEKRNLENKSRVKKIEEQIENNSKREFNKTYSNKSKKRQYSNFPILSNYFEKNLSLKNFRGNKNRALSLNNSKEKETKDNYSCYIKNQRKNSPYLVKNNFSREKKEFPEIKIAEENIEKNKEAEYYNHNVKNRENKKTTKYQNKKEKTQSQFNEKEENKYQLKDCMKTVAPTIINEKKPSNMNELFKQCENQESSFQFSSEEDLLITNLNAEVEKLKDTIKTINEENEELKKKFYKKKNKKADNHKSERELRLSNQYEGMPNQYYQRENESNEFYRSEKKIHKNQEENELLNRYSEPISKNKFKDIQFIIEKEESGISLEEFVKKNISISTKLEVAFQLIKVGIVLCEKNFFKISLKSVFIFNENNEINIASYEPQNEKEECRYIYAPETITERIEDSLSLSWKIGILIHYLFHGSLYFNSVSAIIDQKVKYYFGIEGLSELGEFVGYMITKNRSERILLTEAIELFTSLMDNEI